MTFKLLFSISLIAFPFSASAQLSSSDDFIKLRQCYKNAAWSKSSFSHGSGFLNPVTVYMYQQHEYNALIIPKMTAEGKPQIITLQPGDFRSFTAEAGSVGNECEFITHRNYKKAYYKYNNSYFNFSSVLNSECYNTKKQKPCSSGSLTSKNHTNNFRLQTYKNSDGNLMFCEDIQTNNDHVSEDPWDWQRNPDHFKKQKETLSSSQAQKIVGEDLSERLSQLYTALKVSPSALSQSDATKIYSAVSSHCKGYSPDADKMALKIESLLLTSGFTHQQNTKHPAPVSE